MIVVADATLLHYLVLIGAVDVLTVSLEEDAAIDGEGKRSWVLSRQEKFHLVR